MREALKDSVVVIHTGAIGDLLVATAALEEIYEMFPDRNILVLGNQTWKQIVFPSRWPRIRNLLLLQDKRVQLWSPKGNTEWQPDSKSHSLTFLFKGVQATFNLRMETFRYAWGPFISGVPIRIGCCPKIGKWLYTHYVPWIGLNPIMHERERFLRMVRGYGATQDWSLKGLPNLLPHTTWDSTSTTILINPTSSRREKAWPSERFRECALNLKTTWPELNIVVLGAPAEKRWLKEIAQEDFEIVQPKTLAELIHVVSQAKLLLTNTSSVQFIAAGTRTPVLTLMGRARPEVWSPLGPNAHFIKSDYSEKPGANIFEEEIEAFKLITVDKVFEKANLILAAAAK